MIILIAAMTRDRVIGKEGDIPWRIPEDWKLFKRYTLENTVVMGRRTYESIGRPLPKRRNIIVSSTLQEVEGAEVVPSVEEAIRLAEDDSQDIFICGGSRVYEEALPLADRMYLSLVKKDVKGDTYFPEWNSDKWKEESREEYEDFDFVTYSRTRE